MLSTNLGRGCACDIPSVTYQFSWEPAVWSKYYSNAEEIRQYFKTIVDKYGLMKYMKLQHRVTKAQWDDERGKWVVSLENLCDGTTLHDEGDVIVNCGGFLKYVESKLPRPMGLMLMNLHKVSGSGQISKIRTASRASLHILLISQGMSVSKEKPWQS